jgi:hypothetical protein
MSLPLRSLLVLPVLLVALTPVLHAGDPPTRYFDGAAREIVSTLQKGEGWCAVSERSQVNILPGAPAADCIKYRVVTGFKSGTTSNEQFFVELTYGPETPWIMVELGAPTQSCPSLTAAKACNDAVAKLDLVLGALEPAIAAEEDAAVRALGLQLAGVMRAQRAALVDLIQKDIGAIGMM